MTKLWISRGEGQCIKEENSRGLNRLEIIENSFLDKAHYQGKSGKKDIFSLEIIIWYEPFINQFFHFTTMAFARKNPLLMISVEIPESREWQIVRIPKRGYAKLRKRNCIPSRVIVIKWKISAKITKKREQRLNCEMKIIVGKKHPFIIYPNHFEWDLKVFFFLC